MDERVQTLVKDVLDEEVARRLFPADWETKKIQGYREKLLNDEQVHVLSKFVGTGREDRQNMTLV